MDKMVWKTANRDSRTTPTALTMVELKTPGFAVPGVAGVLLLSLGMFGSYLVGLAEITEILLRSA